MAVTGFKAREVEIMAKAWLCLPEQPKINYKKLADLTGMTSEGSAANAWRAVKKKIDSMNESGDGETEDSVALTPRKRGKMAVTDSIDATTAKKSKGRKSKASLAKAEEEAEDSGTAEGLIAVKGELTDDDPI